jgi:2-polyprenyl-3-methyl-5-hydroxy-6-metoxy-1,4-benzoquinol methylase
MEVVDHMITKEQFSIVSCEKCGFHFTNPIPEKDKIGSYYKGDAYVSHSSSSKGLINRLYGVVRKRTLQQKVSWVKMYASGVELLDVGCGTGHFLSAAKKSGYIITGIEPDEDARSFALQENNIDALNQESLYELSAHSYDIITMWHVLEHVYDLKKDVEQLTKLVKPGGTIFIAVPNMNAYDAREYKSFWAAYDVPRHLYHFQERDVKRLFAQFDFDVVKVLPMKYDAFYVSMLSEKYKNGSLLRALKIALRSNRRSKKYGYSSQVYVLKGK